MKFSMFGSHENGESAAIRRTRAVIEFDLDGKVTKANDLFLAATGYRLDEVVGKPHSLFVDPQFAASAEYKAFWDQLRRGEAFEAQIRRIGKGGKSIWLEAIYTPILDRAGKVEKIVKFASDITERKQMLAGYEGQVQAIRKSQAVIEFDLKGNILDANENFLKTTGYGLHEIKGRHHSMFVDPAERSSEAYARFWSTLARGEYQDGQYRRLGKDGREIWIQASYNVIFDALDQPTKVIKYAADITANKHAETALRLAVEETQSVVASAMAKDLTRRIDTAGKPGEIGQLCGGVNDLLGTVSEIVTAVRDVSVRITAGSSRVGSGAQDLADRTRQQAASLEETAATTEQLSASVKDSSERAREATLMGAEAKESANRGGTVVAEVVVAMERIEKASSDISFIVRVIDDIAFQTNLLALNAAVEAARAGDAGKGFAVVASEVRTLAQRSAEAAKDITNLITNSVGQVASGVKLTKEAGSALSDIVQASSSVALALADISNASREQAHGIEEVAKVVAHLDEMTQRNAIMAEQSTTVADELEQANTALQNLIQGFRVEGSTARPSAGWSSSVPAPMPEARPVTRIQPEPVAPPPRKVANSSWTEF